MREIFEPDMLRLIEGEIDDNNQSNLFKRT